MAKDAKTRGLEALAELYPDPTVRAARTEELGEAGILTLGNSVLRQDDYSRSQNETATTRAEAQRLYEQNQAWWDQHQNDVAELETLRAQVAAKPVGAPDPAKPAAGTLTEEEFTKRIGQTERDAVAFFAELNKLSLQHFQQFGEILDAEALLADRRVQQLGIRGVYADKYAPQIKAKADAARAAEVEAIRADERTKVLAERAQHPYPVRGNDPSTLDGIQPVGTTPVAKSVDEMAAEYSRLSASHA